RNRSSYQSAWPSYRAPMVSGDAFAAVPAGDRADPDRGQDDLDQNLEPVDPARIGPAEDAGDRGADERGHDADHNGEPDRDVLLARHHEPAEGADDEANDKCRDHAADGHVLPPQPELTLQSG